MIIVICIKNNLKIIYLQEGHNSQVGELILTSGDGKIFPRGIPIATVIKVKDKPLYHLKPSKDTLRIWCWDSPELEGVPKLASVSDLYDVDRFSQTNPAAYEYIKK